MMTGSIGTVAVAALGAAGLLFSLQARPDEVLPAATANSTATAPAPPLVLPAMKSSALGAGRAILISGQGVEAVSLESAVRRAAPRLPAAIGFCLDR